MTCRIFAVVCLALLVAVPASAAKVAKLSSIELTSAESGGAVQIAGDRGLEWTVRRPSADVLQLEVIGAKIQDSIPMSAQSALGPIESMGIVAEDGKPPRVQIDIRSEVVLDYLMASSARGLTMNLFVASEPPILDSAMGGSGEVAASAPPTVAEVDVPEEAVPDDVDLEMGSADEAVEDLSADVPVAVPADLPAPTPAEEAPPLDDRALRSAGEALATVVSAVDVLTTAGPTRIRLIGDGVFAYTVTTNASPPQFVIDIEGVRSEAPSKLMLGRGVVQQVQLTERRGSSPAVRVIFTLSVGVSPRVEPRDDGLYFTFPHPEG